ncbi:helix-turn-helix transcriptional regulator [Falsiroseomonas sp. HW251]|uniref:helix-turn-helix transcriptional regulator n=1 Tax=Falsiroseomonas sp. HW251 TaxID=3390998 RepID=UPI003D3176DD
MTEARLLDVTESIYDAAAGGTPWHAVGQGLAALAGARSASLMVADGQGGAELLCHANIPPEAVAAYGSRYRMHDLWTQRAASLLRRSGARPAVLTSGSLVPDAEFLRSEFWNGFGRHYGLRYVVGTVVPLGEAGSMPLGLHRPQDAEPFGEGERRLVEAAVPHLRRALQLRHRLAAVPAGPGAGLAALDGLASGVLVVDASMQVTLANVAAEGMAAAGLGFRFRRSTGRLTGQAALVPCHRADAAPLAALVAAAAVKGEAGGAIRLRSEDGSAAVAALVSPLPARMAGASLHAGGRVPGRALVLLRELAAPAAPRAALLRELFGLTTAEAEVARSLAGGATKAEVAAARGLQETTVRTQVRAVLAKTGAANLRDLERMLAGLAGV